jgi:crossover junction endodeoxyribonuclease RusA
MSRSANPFRTLRGWGVNSRAKARSARRAREPTPRPDPGLISDIALPPGPRVILPWPPAELSPNWRGHWARRARAARSYRLTCRVLARAAGLTLPAEAGPAARIGLRCDFFPPSRARRDDDNLTARFKPGRDGIADALGCDDARFVSLTVLHAEPRGCVVVTLLGAAELPGGRE